MRSLLRPRTAVPNPGHRIFKDLYMRGAEILSTNSTQTFTSLHLSKIYSMENNANYIITHM
jgi:hypothetical protein